MSKYIIVTLKSDETHLTKISSHLVQCKVFNYVILYPEGEKALIRIDNHHKNASITNSSDNLTILELFPDKTKNTVFKVLALHSFYQNFDKYNGAKSGYYYYLTTLAELQNSTLNFCCIQKHE